jgi:hypothetical protein
VVLCAVNYRYLKLLQYKNNLDIALIRHSVTSKLSLSEIILQLTVLPTDVEQVPYAAIWKVAGSNSSDAIAFLLIFPFISAALWLSDRITLEQKCLPEIFFGGGGGVVKVGRHLRLTTSAPSVRTLPSRM